MISADYQYNYNSVKLMVIKTLIYHFSWCEYPN